MAPQQHIRDAVGKPGAKEPYYLAPVLSTFVYALPQTYQRVDAPFFADFRLVLAGFLDVQSLQMSL